MNGRSGEYARMPAAPALWAAAMVGGVLAWPTAVIANNGETAALGEISVTAGRGPDGVELSSVPGSVTVIGREEIERQRAVSPRIDALLERQVPGFSASNHARSNFGENLRGRDYLVMIDGVPVSTPLRAAPRDLDSIDLSAVERVEVVRGAVATYGHGATGGIVNIITRDGRGQDRRWTRVQGSGSVEHPSDSGGVVLEQGFSGWRGDTRYTVTGSVEHNESFFDAEGDRIPPNPYFSQGGSAADTTQYNLQTRLDHSLDDERSVGLRFNRFESQQDSEYIGDFDPQAEEKAGTVRKSGSRANEIDVGTENTTLALDYRDRSMWGQDFEGSVHYQEIEAVHPWWEGFETDYSATTGPGNSILESEKWGLRGEFATVLGGTDLTWGVDYGRDTTRQTISSGDVWVPEMRQDTLAPFAQLQRDFGAWTLRGGVRHETARVDVDDFTTLNGDDIEGGELDYSETVFNLGAVYRIDDTWSAFASFSQGFSLADVGNALRGATGGSIEQADPEAQVVDNYELGLRATGMSWDASVALFESRSDQGTTFDPDNSWQMVQQKERIYGLEADVNVDIGAAWRAGGTLTLIEGKHDTDDDGDYDEYLPGTRISPPKLTTYAEYSASGWTHRAELLYVGGRDRFDDDDVYGQGNVGSYATVDLTMSTGTYGPGTLRVGIENLFNEQYIPALGQAYEFQGHGYVAAPGRRLAAGYEWDW